MLTLDSQFLWFYLWRTFQTHYLDDWVVSAEADNQKSGNCFGDVIRSNTAPEDVSNDSI